MLGKHQPGKVVLAALLFSAIAVSGNGLQLDYGLDGNVVDVLLGLIVMAPLGHRCSHREAIGHERHRTDPDRRRRRRHRHPASPPSASCIGERAGVVNLGIEGCMLAGALTAYAVGVSTGSAWIGALVGIAAGAAVALIHALARGACAAPTSSPAAWPSGSWPSASRRCSASSYVNQTVDAAAPIADPGLSTIPWVGPILFDHDILVYVGYLLVGSSGSCSSGPGWA